MESQGYWFLLPYDHYTYSYAFSQKTRDVLISLVQVELSREMCLTCKPKIWVQFPAPQTQNKEIIHLNWQINSTSYPCTSDCVCLRWLQRPNSPQIETLFLSSPRGSGGSHHSKYEALPLRMVRGDCGPMALHSSVSMQGALRRRGLKGLLWQSWESHYLWHILWGKGPLVFEMTCKHTVGTLPTHVRTGDHLNRSCL